MAMRWKDVPAFLTRHVYALGESPRENHPAQWPKLDKRRYGQLYGSNGERWWTVAVASTGRSRDGWTYNVAELQARPVWVGYFHHGPTNQRIKHADSGASAQQLAQAFGIYELR
jgi:hypothetical protein